MAWLVHNEASLALSTVTVAEIAYGIHKIAPDQRSSSLSAALDKRRRRLAERIFGFTEQAALVYGEMMGKAARQGVAISVPDGMIAAIAQANGGRLATRNLADFRATGVALVSPWEFMAGD